MERYLQRRGSGTSVPRHLDRLPEQRDICPLHRARRQTRANNERTPQTDTRRFTLELKGMGSILGRDRPRSMTKTRSEVVVHHRSRDTVDIGGTSLDTERDQDQDWGQKR